MKCYICLTDSIVTRKDYLDLLKVMLISARKNTSLHLVCLYDGNTNDPVYNLLKEFNVEIILHQLPYKLELMEIYPREWMLQNLGKEIEELVQIKSSKNTELVEAENLYKKTLKRLIAIEDDEVAKNLISDGCISY